MKKFMLFLAAVMMILSPLAASQAMSVTWEWLLDDPEVNYYRYQLDGQADDAWTVVDGTVSSFTADGLDPYSDYTLYLQRSYDGIYWSASAEAVAEALLVEEVPETVDITPVIEEPVLEEPVEAIAEEAPVEELAEEPVEETVLEAPVVDVVPDVAPAYVAEEPVEEPVEATGEQIVASDEPVATGEETAEETEEAVDAVEEIEETAPVEEIAEEAPVEEIAEEAPVEEVPAEEEAPAPEVIEVEPVDEAPVEEAARNNDFRFSLLLKGGFTNALDFDRMDSISFSPAFHGDLALDFANIVKMGNNCGLGLRLDLINGTAIPNRTGWRNTISSFKTLVNLKNYAYSYDPALYVTFDGRAGIVNFNLGLGFEFGMMSPNATAARADQFGFNDSFNLMKHDWPYRLAPSAVLGMRFYCGDLFSIGIEGAYSATVGDWKHHDVSADIVMGFSF